LTTSLTETLNTSVAIGEQIWVPLYLTIPLGYTKSVNLTIALPTTNGKLIALYGDILYYPPDTTSAEALTTPANLGDSTGDGINDFITFPLGNILNNATGTTNSTITFLVSMLVSSDASTFSGETLTSIATLTYSNGSNNFYLYASFSLKVVEPFLVLSNAASSTSYIASGTVVTFTLILSNNASSTGPAYYVEIYDGLSSSYKLNYGSVVASYGNVTIGNNPNDTVVRVDIISILPTTTVTVKFNATLQDIVQPSTVVYNTAVFNISSALYTTYNTNNIRNQSGYATSSRTISSPTLSFVLNYTTIPAIPEPEVTIGEAASLVATLSIPQVSHLASRITRTSHHTSSHITHHTSHITHHTSHTHTHTSLTRFLSGNHKQCFVDNHRAKDYSENPNRICSHSLPEFSLEHHNLLRWPERHS
jgi:hypothetical protein